MENQVIQAVEKSLEYLEDTETHSLGYANTRLNLELLKQSLRQTELLTQIVVELKVIRQYK